MHHISLPNSYWWVLGLAVQSAGVAKKVLWGHHDISSRHFPGTLGNNKPTILAFCGLWDTLAQKFVFSALEIKIRIICELFSECWNMILELPKSNYNLRDSAVQALQ